jgi:hypothetical protein
MAFVGRDVFLARELEPAERFVRNNDTFQIEDETPSEADSGITKHWDSFVLLSVAWVLFELFAEPALSIVVCSIKFGWKDFANAFWLWRRDPIRHRARAVGAFNIAAGFWRITVSTIALIVGAMVVNGILIGAQRGGPFKQEDGVWAGLTLLIITLCFVMSSITTYVAMVLCWWGRLRVWIDPTVSYSRKKNSWPPRPTGKNQISRVITTSLILLALALILGSVLIIAATARKGQPPGPLVFLPMIAIVLSALLILGGRERILKSLAADTPQECWYTDPLETTGIFIDDDHEDYFDANRSF